MKVKVTTSPTQTEFEEVDLTLTTRRGSECLIGRSPDSDLVLDSDDVSRLHGKFFSQGGNYYFCDVGSRNGSIVNGKLAEKDRSYVLRNGDIIRIGDFMLMLEDEMPDSQQAETVVRIINPSVFSNWRSQNEGVAQEPQPAINQLSNESVSSHPAETPHEQKEQQEVVNTSREVEQKEQPAEQVEQSEPTFIQPENITIPQSAIESPHESNEAFEHHDEPTVVPFSDINQHNAATDVEHQTENVASTEHELEQEDLNHDYTVVQAHDVVSQDNAATDVEHQTENVASTEHEEVATHTHDEHETEEAHHEEARETIEAVSNDNEKVEVDTPSQQHVEEQLEEELMPESVSVSTQPLKGEEIATSHDEEVLLDTEEPELEEAESEKSFIQLAKVLEEKQIVLVAHDSKKSELTELVAEHEEFLSYCLTRTWQTFSDDLYKQTGLSVTQEIPPANSGGYQAINSLVNSGEILAVIFIRDLMAPQKNQASEEALLRICNINNVLLATNLPTARAILHYLKNLKD
ncbi:FHA domain-containing protein [Dulcicalothrix desertica]|uniref:FHA domain-containing protein n=1 Tax=Dulcicalothrix desertica TaxID=32056 RepID=UPI00119ACFE6|nr:FHA domain-containing protein [Dulcicalothrix desertica]TWH40009.1 methylglyoxal synthase [Dulcicalothrix desertica PCC 7102]